MLTVDQTRRLLRTAEQHAGEPATVALFLLATTDAIQLQQICRLDVADVDAMSGGTSRLALRLLGGSVLVLPPVVTRQVSAHLAAYPRARELSAGDGPRRVPLLRNRVGGRTSPSALGHGIRRIAAGADHDIRSLAHRITPGWLSVVDLFTW
ncbi:hypothetical protein Psuf_090800 [Phytohabitans suffuscus]|uniref:Uncharacterized protein n=1 Tax=Phytohabitans suffuscus TaxID=624315 RepID=A0A6F8Z053_9ACTN|nr:hypothetical protein [Phytohabitans suffuscus]BCB91767.1 hypothetical protein Psuf_090800 [Phytohabitans suffuscus]